MAIPTKLSEGYARFRNQQFPDQSKLYASLAAGQTPKIMVIACADSRADPAMIFSSRPGELFVVRNVANLVPPYEEAGQYHGVSAALEFGITVLKVKHLVVLGHAKCGGIAACLAAKDSSPVGQFIAPWVEIAAPARNRVLNAPEEYKTEDDRQLALERSAIEHSITNLKGFHFVQDALDSGQLNLHGGWFSILDGTLFWMDPKTKKFQPVTI